ncbi:MAG: DNA alkylation repair protein [Prevotella sp.]|nr:DNA alkylation repair protein [Prevotella sp.]
MQMDVNNTVKTIKQQFFLRMNGETARSMREKGVQYHLNWGISLPDLKQMACNYPKDFDLAIALWKEDIRECKIMALMLMPPEKMLPEIVDIWMEQTTTQELAELSAFYLYQYLEYASVIAFEWIATEDEMKQICGYHILSRLFMKGNEPDERGIHELLDQIIVALKEDNAAVKRAAYTCLQRFSQLGDVYETIANNAMHVNNLDFL